VIKDCVLDSLKSGSNDEERKVAVHREKFVTEYESYPLYHAIITVDTVVFHGAISRLMSTEVWPSGLLVRQFLIMPNLNTDLSICSFNCRSIKSSLPKIYQLCESHNIVCLPEHWLLPAELNMMSQTHPVSSATSAVAVDNDVLTGRLYGETAILLLAGGRLVTV